MKNIEIYVKHSGTLENARKMGNFCGLYASIGPTWNNPNGVPGELYCVMCGPQLWPAYDRNGNRINVGANRAGKSYDEKRNIWYNE